jgi:hypothetical protein
VPNEQLVPNQVALAISVPLVRINFVITAEILLVLEQQNHSQQIADLLKGTFVKHSVLRKQGSIFGMLRVDVLSLGGLRS